tara:strand:- start:97 stop:1965 length:1869 start_codon:yes stop_codon:yes gene_type:complete
MNIISEERLGIRLYKMGLRNKDLVDALAVAEMESGFKEEAYNYDEDSEDDSYGIFQINFYEGLGPERERRLGLDREELKDFENNLRGFAMLFKSRGYTFKDWSTHPSSKYFDPNKRREWNDAVRKAKKTLNSLAADGLIGSEGDEDWRIADDDHELFSYVINPEIARVQKILNDRYGHDFDLDGDTGSGPQLDIWADAVRDLQEDIGVTVDGDWGSNSQAAFNQAFPDLVQTGEIKNRLGTQAIVYDDQGNIVSGGPEVMVGETASFEELPTGAPPVIEEEEIVIQDPNRSGQFANPEQDLEESIESKTSKLDILMWEYLRGNPSVLVEHPITGEMVDLVELIEENPLGLEDGTPEMEQWIKSIYYQTDHYQDSEVGRADREYKWNSGGDTEDEWSTRRLDLISIQVEQLEQILGQANINLDDSQIWELAKQSYLQGLNLAEIKDFLVTATTDAGSPLFNFGEGAPAGGTVSAFRTSIKDIYRRYLMEPDEEVLARRSQQLFSGETTIDLVEDEMIEQAALLFPAWATRIEAGKSPLEIVGAYNGIFNSVLGYSPQWDGRNRDMAVTLGGLMVEGEEPGTAMSGGDFARWLRTTEEYDQSPRGINDAYQLVTGLGRAMGAVA